MLITKSYKLRLYPNKEQEKKLVAILDASRWVFNHYLQERKNYYLSHKKTLSYAHMARNLTQIRRVTPCLMGIQAEPLQQSLRRLDTAYNSFFRKQNRFPRFKSSMDSRRSFQKHQDWRLLGRRIQIQADLQIKFRGYIDEQSKMGTLIISNCSDKWFASITSKTEGKLRTKYTKPIGIDVGVSSLVTISNGKKFENPRVRKNLQQKLTRAQRVLARKKIGSKRRNKAKKLIANIHEKITNIRSNNSHKISREVVNTNPSLIAMESLSVSKMMKNHNMAYSLADASLSYLLKKIEYKQIWNGGKVIKIDRYFPSSKTCSKCGFILDSLPLRKRSWKCPKCNVRHDRDINAAKNILKQAE